MTRTDDQLDGLIATFLDAGRLKRLKRAGWVRAGLSDVESVADHSYRVALLALIVAPRLNLDADRAVRLALLHDLAEARVGDLTPADGVTPADKHARESIAFAEIVAGLAEGPGLLDLWREYDEGTTAEARLVHQLDKLELAIQALEYERSDNQDLTEFWVSARAGIDEPWLLALFRRLEQQRPTRSG